MTTEAKIRNILHYFLGGVFAYCAVNKTVYNMNEFQTFILSGLVGCLVGILVGTAIEIYQNWILKQRVDWDDIKRTAKGGVLGGILFVCQPNLVFIAKYLFWGCIAICVLEVLRSQLAKIKLLKK